MTNVRVLLKVACIALLGLGLTISGSLLATAGPRGFRGGGGGMARPAFRSAPSAAPRAVSRPAPRTVSRSVPRMSPRTTGYQSHSRGCFSGRTAASRASSHHVSTAEHRRASASHHVGKGTETSKVHRTHQAAEKRRESGTKHEALSEHHKNAKGKNLNKHAASKTHSKLNTHKPDGKDHPGHPNHPGHPGDADHHHHHHHPAPPPPPPPCGPYPYYYYPRYDWWVDEANFDMGFLAGYAYGAEYSYCYYYPTYGSSDSEDASDDQAKADDQANAEDQTKVDDQAKADDQAKVDDQAKADDSKDVVKAEMAKITKESVDSAWETLQKSDELFGQGKFDEAVAGYEKVAKELSLMPDAYFRLAVADMAKSNYQDASDHLMQGMEKSKNWPSSPFTLNYMYRDQTDQKNADLAKLEKAATDWSDKADIQLLAGMMLYMDGQSENAVPYLQNAQSLDENLGNITKPLLENIEKVGTKEKEKEEEKK